MIEKAEVVFNSRQLLDRGNMDIITHNRINQSLCGTPVLVEENHSIVELTTSENMVADDSGLVHGGFIFGLADYAAMIAINHPNVVLGSSEVKFLKPVKLNDKIIAEAIIKTIDGKKRTAHVNVKRNNDIVFDGIFTCFVLAEHILS